MSADVIYLPFDWGAHLALGRRRLVLEPGVHAVLGGDAVICATAVPGETRPSAQVDVHHPARPSLHLAMAVGEITVAGGCGLYLRAVQTRSGFPTAFVVDVSELDYSPAWSQALS